MTGLQVNSALDILFCSLAGL